jgi:hypothetical protein
MGDELAIVDTLVDDNDDDQKEFVAVANASFGEENVDGNKMRRSILIEVVVVVVGICFLFVNNVVVVVSVCAAEEARVAVTEKISSSKSFADELSNLCLDCSRP